MPLQPGFGWLAADGSLIQRREDIDEIEALASFRSDLESHASSWGEAQIRMEALIEADRQKKERHREAVSLDGLDVTLRIKRQGFANYFALLSTWNSAQVSKVPDNLKNYAK